MNKRKIIIAGPLPPPYFGVSNATKITLNGLKDVFEIFHLDTSDRRESFNFGKYDFHNIYLGIKSICDCIKLLLKNPDILYLPISQSFPAYFRDAGFILLGYLFKKKIVLHLRGGYFKQFYEDEKGFRKFLIKYTISKASKIIVLGEMLKKIFKNLAKSDAIEVVSNGVDTIYFKPDYNKRQEKVRICFLSNFEISKGWREILECAVLIKKDVSTENFEFVMAGKWRNQKDEIYAHKFIRDHHIENIVTLKKDIIGDEKLVLLQSSHIFLMPTSYKYEGQPWAIIEAMACGLPVISSPKGCIEETIKDGINGFIIPHNDIGRMKSILLKLINEKELINYMGNESVNIVRNNFSQQIFLNKLQNIFTNV